MDFLGRGRPLEQVLKRLTSPAFADHDGGAPSGPHHLAVVDRELRRRTRIDHDEGKPPGAPNRIDGGVGACRGAGQDQALGQLKGKGQGGDGGGVQT